MSQFETLDKTGLSLYTKPVPLLKGKKIIAALFLIFLPCLSFALSGHGKIIWISSKKSPCVFKRQDGTPYNPGIIVCYYMRANLKDPVSQFNRLPTEASQNGFLHTISQRANVVYLRWGKQAKAILNWNDLKNIPPDETPEAKLQTLMEMKKRVLRDGKKACEPFLWPQAEGSSYLHKTNGSWPKTWRPFMRPFYDRYFLLGKKAQELESKEVGRSQKKVQSLLSKIQGFKTRMKTGGFSMAQGSVQAWDSEKDVRDAELPGLLRHFVLDQKSPQPPSPHLLSDAEYRRRGYFNRGFVAGMERLKDDALLSWSHSSGLSRTVGDPGGKARNIIHQKNGACAVEAQYEVLKSYGQHVTPKGLANEAFRKGYYLEPQLKSGDSIAGTPWNDVGKLLRDHGLSIHAFPLTSKNATRNGELDKAIKDNGGALVGVGTTRLWNNPAYSGTHEIFVTGEEVSNKTGQVLGYYINDTGTGEAMRFISKNDFDRAWRDAGYELITFHEKSKK